MGVVKANYLQNREFESFGLGTNNVMLRELCE